MNPEVEFAVAGAVVQYVLQHKGSPHMIHTEAEGKLAAGSRESAHVYAVVEVHMAWIQRMSSVVVVELISLDDTADERLVRDFASVDIPSGVENDGHVAQTFMKSYMPEMNKKLIKTGYKVARDDE